LLFEYPEQIETAVSLKQNNGAKRSRVSGIDQDDGSCFVVFGGVLAVFESLPLTSILDSPFDK
jgi:hypothetical protein